MSTTDAVNHVIDEARGNRMLLGEGQRLLDALGHGDCVPRKRGSPLSQCDHGVQAWECRTCVDAEMDYMRDRAERAERERDASMRTCEGLSRDLQRAEEDNERLREALRWYAEQDRYEPCTGAKCKEPTWVKAHSVWDCDGGARARAALSADADADAEPEPEPDCKYHKHSRSPAFGRTHLCPRCGRYTFPPEPSRAEGDAHPDGLCECGEPMYVLGPALRMKCIQESKCPHQRERDMRFHTGGTHA